MNMIVLGRLFLILAPAWALVLAGTALAAERTHDLRWRESARGAAVGLFLFLTAAVLALEYLLVTGDFQVDAVYQHTNATLPLMFRIGALWGGDSGSILFWAWLLSLYTVFAAWWDAERYPRLATVALVPLAGLLLFFTGVDAFVSNPFRLVPGHPGNGVGLDPLLQNLVMLLHPPAMYTGLVGMALPFTYLLAAVWLKQGGTEWIPLVRRRMLFAWLVLSIALVLGGMWSYMVLGWGGYWEWDPVENAALLPWLTATVFLHMIQADVHSRRVQWWTAISAVASFLLTLLGTYITRSGVLKNSVHSFVGSGIGPWFVGLFWVSLAASAALLLWRRQVLAPPRVASHVLRENPRGNLLGWFALLMTWLAAAVLFGTLYPVFSKWVLGMTVVLNQSFFDAVAIPAFLVVIALLGIAPFTGWRSAQVSLPRLAMPVTVGLLAAAWSAGVLPGIGPLGLLAFALCGFAAGSIVRELIGLLTLRRPGRGFLSGVGQDLARQRRRIGAHIAHLAFLLVALGVIGSHVGSVASTVKLTRGAAATVDGYTVRYLGLDRKQYPDREVVQALLAVKGYGHAFTITSGDAFFPGSAQPVADIAIRGGLMSDLYIVLEGWTGQGQSVTLQVMVNPMVSWIWIGMYVLIAGTLLVLSRADVMRQDASEFVWELAPTAMGGKG